MAKNSKKHPKYSEIVEQLKWKPSGTIKGKFDETDLIIHPEAATPQEIESAFDDLFKIVKRKAKDVKDQHHLDKIAKPFVTTLTKQGARVFNNERQYGRVAKFTKRTTPLRDVNISHDDLDNMAEGLERLSNDVPIYRMYVRAGSGSEVHWFETYFTPEGAKLILAGGIMMHASFNKPNATLTGRYFAMPEYQEVVNPNKPENVNPMRLSYLSNKGKASVFVAGTTYPGDIYKPFCEALNGIIYMHGGVEFHGSAVLVEYKSPKSNKKVKKIAVISGLSLHGKSTLSSVQLSQLSKSLEIDLDDMPSLKATLFHDDYIAFKVTEEGLVEVIVYAPNGIFPAVNSNPDNKPKTPGGRVKAVLADPITAGRDTVFFNVPTEDGQVSPWDEFNFEEHHTGKVKKVRNLRACAPLDEDTFQITIAEPGVYELTSLDYVTLTRDPNTPAGLLWNSLEEALLYASGLVVAPTDAESERAAKPYLNYLATVFETAARGPLLNRILLLFEKMKKMGIEVRGLTMNTGAPGPEESKAILANIITDSGKWIDEPALKVQYLSKATGYDDEVYIPWIDKKEIEEVVDAWTELARMRTKHLEAIHCDLDKSGLLKESKIKANLINSSQVQEFKHLLTRGAPPAESIPLDEVVYCLRKMGSKMDSKELLSMLMYGDKKGLPSLREWIANDINQSSDVQGAPKAKVDINNIVISSAGGLSLIAACARMFQDRTVVVAEKTYDRTIKSFRDENVNMVSVPIDDDGIDVDKLEEEIEDNNLKVDAIYIIPNFQNPTGVTLSLERRKKLARLAKKHNLIIIEDDPYRRLIFSGKDLPSLRSMVPERTIYMESVSKIIAPGFRVAYAASSTKLADKLEKILEDRGICPSYPAQVIVSKFLNTQSLSSRIDELKAMYEPRLNATLETLNKHMSKLANWKESNGGFFVSIELKNESISTEELLQKAKEAGIKLTDGRNFCPEKGKGDRLIRIPFATMKPSELRVVIEKLAKIVESFE